jgi:L-asparaginase II
LPLLLAGGRERLALEPADLAVMAASHEGTDLHAARVAAILARAGFSAADLRCGIHRPYYLDDLPLDSGEQRREFGPLHNNCSGNHAAMLALARLHGVEPERYLDAAAPHQEIIHGVVAALSGAEPHIAVDDCGAPCYALPLVAMAEAYRFLADPEAVFALPAARRERLAAAGALEAVAAGLELVAAAMAREPEWVSGPATEATRLARLAPGEIVAKYGAEGILCVAHRASGSALALKVADGDARALMPASLPLQADLGWLPPAVLVLLSDIVEPRLVGLRGRIVGRLRLAAGGSPASAG